MIDTLLVVLIVGLAAFWVGRRFFTSFRQGSECGCGCSGCTVPDNCPDPTQGHDPASPSATSK